MSGPWPNVWDVIRFEAPDAETLAHALVDALLVPLPDPFTPDLILTRSGGLQRWLTQRIARRAGVAARLRFSTVAAAMGTWSADDLLAPVLAALADLPDTPEFTGVRRYLADPATRPYRRAGLATLAARRFAAYARWRPELMISDLPAPDRWQAGLWALVSAGLPRTAPDLTGFARIAVFCPDELTPAEADWLAGLDATQPVMVFTTTLADGPLTRAARAVTAELDRVAPVRTTLPAPRPDRPTVLQRVQHRLATGETLPGPDDDTVVIAPVAPDRQVEALSDVLVGALAADPTLEPRDILVLVHRLDRLGPELAAAFRPDEAAHPRHAIRAAVAPAGPDPDPAVDVLRFVLDLVDSRATSQDLDRLCRLPGVVARYGFTDADLDRLTALIASSGIRWGINAATRARWDMAGFGQNTWVAGLGRMVLGVALREDDLAYRGTVLPLDVTDSDTVRLVGALGQIIAHARTAAETWTTPVPVGEWRARFRAVLDGLAPPEWATGPAGRAVAGFGTGCTGVLSLAEVAGLFQAEWQSHVRPSWFCNGDLAIAPLGAMSGVPHKLVVLLGLDDATFPQATVSDGDDLLATDLPAGADPLARDRQIVCDAVMAARARFVALYTGGITTPPEAIGVPTPLADVARIATAVPPAPAVRVIAPVPPVLPTGRVPAGTQIGLDDLTDLFANPAAYWLRRQAGLGPSALTPDDPLPTELPADLTGLEIWQITDRMVRLVLAGQPPSRIVDAELRRGTLPPGPAGVRLAGDLAARAADIAARARAARVAPETWRDITLAGEDGTTLTGVIGTVGETVVDVLAGRAAPRHQLSAWIRLLVLRAAYPDGDWRGVIVANRTTVRLTPPPPQDAARALATLRRLYLTGLTTPLPLPGPPAAYAARYAARRLPPDPDGLARRLDEEWARDPAWPLLWGSPAALPQAGPDGFQAMAEAVYVPLMRGGGVL